MSLPHEVEEILQRWHHWPHVVRNHLRKTFGDPDWNRSLTRAVLMGAHKLPPPAKFFGGLCLPMPVWAFPLAATSTLEWLIEQLAHYASRHGTLTPKQRKQFEDFISYRLPHLPSQPR